MHMIHRWSYITAEPVLLAVLSFQIKTANYIQVQPSQWSLRPIYYTGLTFSKSRPSFCFHV